MDAESDPYISDAGGSMFLRRLTILEQMYFNGMFMVHVLSTSYLVGGGIFIELVMHVA